MELPLPPQSCARCGAVLEPAELGGLCAKCVALVAFDPASDLAMRLSGENHPIFEGYELLGEIARGGMGVVFKARQISLNRIVALKTLIGGPFADETELKRFRAEAESLAHLQHPNIVAIHEVGENEGSPYFTMDFVEGKNLAEIGRSCPLDANRAARYVETVARAIGFAHQHGILHRDLKPSNVLIDTFDQPRVTDFGLAKRLADDLDLTRTGQVIGTPNFFAPEQATGNHQAVGPWSDVYSIGAILYFLLTVRPPFQGRTLAETLSRTLGAEAAPPSRLNSTVPRDLETICLKCLEKNPQRRYATAAELADDAGRFLRDEPILARSASVMERAWRWGRQHPSVTSFAASLALTLAAVLTVFYATDIGRKRSATLPKARITAQPASIIVEVDGATLSQTIIGEGNDIAVDPKNNNVWSPTFDSGGVIVRDGRTDVVLTNLALFACPCTVNLDPVRRVAWVGAQCGNGDDPLWVIDANTFVVTAGPIHCGGVNAGPTAVNPATGRFYHQVGLGPQRVDPDVFTRTRTAFGPVIGINPSQNLIYATGPGGSLQIINGANDPESVLTNVTLPFTIDTAGPIAIARARNQLYIPNGASNNIAVVDGRNGRTIKVFALEPKFGLVDQVRGVAIDESRSRVYAVARTRGGSCCLYAISDGIQTAISIPAEAAGPVLSPALNKLYLWIVPLPAANPP